MPRRPIKSKKKVTSKMVEDIKRLAGTRLTPFQQEAKDQVNFDYLQRRTPKRADHLWKVQV